MGVVNEVHMAENEQQQVAMEIAVDCSRQQAISKSGPNDDKVQAVSGSKDQIWWAQTWISDDIDYYHAKFTSTISQKIILNVREEICTMRQQEMTKQETITELRITHTTWTPPPDSPITGELDVPSDEESGDDGEQ